MIGLLRPVVLCALGPAARRHRAAWDDPAAAQAAVRARAWAGLRDTAYGARFARFEDLPVVTWEEMAPWMARQAAGEGAIVTRERVRFWEPTSGSSGPPKRIPYTASLRSSFSRMFATWAHDLVAHGPRLRTGRCWFTVTPRFDDPTPAGDGAPVGTADDRDYLDGPLRALMAPFWVMPPGLAAERDPEGWRRRVATALCAERGLEVVSAWSPTLLTTLLDWMVAHRDTLPNAALVGDWRRLWPELKIVSVWDAGSASAPAARLRAMLAGAEGPGPDGGALRGGGAPPPPGAPLLVQGKGLLTTEGPVTVPLVGLEEAGAPLVAEVGIELLDEAGGLVPVARAEEGRRYEVVLTQCAGLARYRLGDVVEARGRVGATPALRFLGRARTVDLAGEKLTEAVVAAAFARVGVPAGSALVAAGDHYRLEVDAPFGAPGLGERVDAALAEQHHYRLARDLGQLGPVRVTAAPGRARRTMEAARVWGGAKGAVLVGETSPEGARPPGAATEDRPR